MERTIDRTSYRRSARAYPKASEKINEDDEQNVRIPTNRKFKITNMILNQTIVSLLIVIGILTAQYYEYDFVNEWISSQMSNGYTAKQIVSIIKNRISNNNNNTKSFYSILHSGEEVGEDNSGEVALKKEYGDVLISGESVNSGELLSAVEGINQMSCDAKAINENYHFYLPLKGVITSNFGSRVSDSSIVSSYHAGVDIAANTGSEIHCAHDGKVVMAKMFSTYGNCVMIEDGKVITVYAHCSSINVTEGQNVKAGDVIAKVGSTGNATGPHLHFEVRYDGRFVDPLLIIGDKI